VIDSVEELKKIQSIKGDAQVYLRIDTPNIGSDWPLAGKFAPTPPRCATSSLLRETQGRPRGRRLPRGLAVPQPRKLARRHRKVARGFRPDAKSRTQSATSEHRRGFPSEARQADPAIEVIARCQPGAGRVS